MAQTRKPTFVLGVGAQKTGTSWLYRYLDASSKTALGFQKEYHIWDAKFMDLGRPFRVKEHQIGKDLNLALRFAMQRNDGFYETYFKSLMADGTASVTADITPSYCGLSADDFVEIKRRIESVGFDLKVVFLMRDPVARCWSATRMVARLRTESGKPTGQTQMARLFGELFPGPEYAYRTRYDATIRNLEQAFDKDQLFYGIYESLFTQSTTRALADFLGIEFMPDRHGVRANSSPRDEQLPDDLARACRDFYVDTYAFCAERFPQTRELWSAHASVS